MLGCWVLAPSRHEWQRPCRLHHDPPCHHITRYAGTGQAKQVVNGSYEICIKNDLKLKFDLSTVSPRLNTT